MTADSGRAVTLSYLMILVMKLRVYVKSAQIGIRTRRMRMLGYSFNKLSTSAYIHQTELLQGNNFKSRIWV